MRGASLQAGQRRRAHLERGGTGHYRALLAEDDRINV